MHISKEPRRRRLCDLSPGHGARIQHIDPSSALCHRMADMGLREGTFVYCERRSILGDPCAYRIGHTGTVVALRRCDAYAVYIREDGDHLWA